MAAKKETFISNIDSEKLKSLLNDTAANVTIFNTTCMDIVKKYSEALDNLMSDLYVECIKEENADTKTLEKYYLELTNMIYFMNERLEEIGVYADISETSAKEAYSKSYLSSQDKDRTGKNKTTVAECQATAELSSQYESVVSTIYKHAYKVVKGKIESGQDMMNTLRKILTVRANELNMSTFDSSNKFPQFYVGKGER